MKGFLAKLDVWSQDTVQQIQDSEWKEDQNSMQLTQLAKMLVLSKFMARVDEITSDRLYQGLAEKDTTAEINYYQQTYNDMPTTSDSYLMPMNPQQNQSQNNTRFSRTLTRNQGKRDYR